MNKKKAKYMSVRLFRETYRLLKIESAIRDEPMSVILDKAVKREVKKN